VAAPVNNSVRLLRVRVEASRPLTCSMVWYLRGDPIIAGKLAQPGGRKVHAAQVGKGDFRSPFGWLAAMAQKTTGFRCDPFHLPCLEQLAGGSSAELRVLA
jgi:hypothetical protein